MLCGGTDLFGSENTSTSSVDVSLADVCAFLEQGIELSFTYVEPLVMKCCCCSREGGFLSDCIGNVHIQSGLMWGGGVMG